MEFILIEFRIYTTRSVHSSRNMANVPMYSSIDPQTRGLDEIVFKRGDCLKEIVWKFQLPVARVTECTEYGISVHVSSHFDEWFDVVVDQNSLNPFIVDGTQLCDEGTHAYDVKGNHIPVSHIREDELVACVAHIVKFTDMRDMGRKLLFRLEIKSILSTQEYPESSYIKCTVNTSNDADPELAMTVQQAIGVPSLNKLCMHAVDQQELQQQLQDKCMPL
jgi:hypothetical protein